MKNYDDWKLSNPIDDGRNNGMVSYCCGDDYEEEVPICAECGSFDIGEKWIGDEGWTICDDCRATEQGYDYVNVCEKCGDECKIEEEYEYNERQKENAQEMNRDE
ncbi:MAG: hypothetical protein H8E55_08965 [Pelagibacterales bacterium]|nr:hypothetical protein [Pelagibacterales bacterium]